MEELMIEADKHYQEACSLNRTAAVCVQYANYLYYQGQSPDALLTMLPFICGNNQPEDENNVRPVSSFLAVLLNLTHPWSWAQIKSFDLCSFWDLDTIKCTFL